MAQAAVQRAHGDERLTPQVRNVLLALIVGGIAAISARTARSSGSPPPTCWPWRSQSR
jgi:hypothetical protein